MLIDDLPRNGGEAALDGIVDIVKLSQKLPAEQFQAAMLSVQAMMGPMKLVVSVVANAAAEAVAGDQYREFKESKAIELAAKLTDRTVETMKGFHEEAKVDPDNLLHGNEYVVATEFLMDAVLGEVKSLRVKAGSTVFANGAKGINKIFEPGRTPKASELKQYAEAQGWKPVQTGGGTLKYLDANGIPRVTIKQGSSRAPGSADPHVEFKSATGQRTDAFGNPVTRKSPDNHTSIDFDL
ncbi:hypothetical protein [Pseudomonas sp. AU8050]|uniref:hypothetical protein n=1 Tax=Pseudomonas sp. AU8050 TaxID=2681497 RepID=UPI00140C0974|nr:hypothetical protein [Pseudomonas sp. AU8050]NHC51533.1 hypothetical protein [Pseudomonas sp. AU8050]